MTDSVRYELEGAVAVVRLDDGKANAITNAVIDAVHGALDRAETEARAVVLIGRPQRFSGGFDLSVMRQGREAVQSLVTAGAELALRLYGFPRPVVAACTGHAIAMGAIVLLASDLRIGADGPFKIGLNEVGNGMTLPVFGVELARERLSKRHLTRAALTAELYTPSEAVDAGYLDRVVPPESLESASRAEAERLTTLDANSFAGTKRRLRGAVIDHIRGALAGDMQRLGRGE